MTYPIAEIFHSPQGEGSWTGTYMCFVRLAGCTVGKPYTVDERKLQVLQPYQEKCTAWNGVEFACDTNYRLTAKMSVAEIVEAVGSTPRVCITGGEPLMHDLLPLLQALRGKHIHIETSGTKSLEPYYAYTSGVSLLWLTVSPKAGCLGSSLAYASEIKVLVDAATFKEELFIRQFGSYFSKTWIQPINDEHTIREDNLRFCIELQKKFPLLGLSLQTHKIMKVR